MLDAELSVSTRPAFLTAVTSVDSSGLAEAAVATGAVAMPVKLPAPDAGTDAQPGPKFLAAVAAEDDAIGDEAEAIGEDDDEAGAAAGEDEDEPHAAGGRLRAAARAGGGVKRDLFLTASP